MSENMQPEGSDNQADADVATLTQEIESLKSALTGRDADVAKLESIKAELVEARNDLKKRQADALAEQGKFKELYEAEAVETVKIREQLDAEKKTRESYESKVKAIETERRTELLELLPEGQRDEFKDFGLDALQKVVKVLGTDKGGVPRGGSKRPADNATPWDKMSDESRAAYMESHTASEIAEKMKQ